MSLLSKKLEKKAENDLSFSLMNKLTVIDEFDRVEAED